MLQLPPDSHFATPDQSCDGAAEAGAARTPMPTAAAPRVTAPPRSSERVRARVIEMSWDMRDPPITAGEVSCRVRANRCPAGRVVERTVSGFTPRRARARRKWVPRPRPGVLEVRRRRTGFGGPVPRAPPVWPGHADDRK